jgi:dihydropyrimidinase
MDLAVTNGTIITANSIFNGSIGISNGKIAQIGGPLPNVNIEIDATGCYVMPGGVDVHTHLDLAIFNSKSADDFHSGTIAAACGGTTSVVDFCVQEKGETLSHAIELWDKKAQGKAAIDYGYHMIIHDITDAVIAELATLPRRGISSFKLFMAYRNVFMVDDIGMIQVMEAARRHGALVMVHAENGDIADYLGAKLVQEGKVGPEFHVAARPPRVEAEATSRALALAELVGAPVYVVHLTCEEAFEELLNAKMRGVNALAETCTHYLFLTQEVLSRPNFEGAKFVCSPPPRLRRDQAVLWRALKEGLLETVSSDHCSWLFKGHKDKGLNDFRLIPSGVPGVEERLMLVYQGTHQGHISLMQFVDLVATRPARVFGMYPQKGAIAVGSDADIIIWDPDASVVITQSEMHNQMDYSSYEGTSIQGVPRTVLLRGKVIVENRKYIGTPGEGRFIHRRRFMDSAKKF